MQHEANMTSEDFISHVTAHAGVSIGLADTATRIVLSAFGGCLSGPRRQLIAEELPPGLRAALLNPTSTAQPLEELLGAPGEKVGHVREMIASVCRVLAEELSTEALASLRAAVPADLRRFLAEPARETSDEQLVPGMRDTLSSGKPGSHHPISDTPADRRQSDSVASSNPHGATKLSSSPGTTQELGHETLAEAQTDPRRKLSTAKG
jgi:uncharacterized protein (DUF2267 family)